MFLVVTSVVFSEAARFATIPNGKGANAEKITVRDVTDSAHKSGVSTAITYPRAYG
jgi:hypothetical protein